MILCKIKYTKWIILFFVITLSLLALSCKDDGVAITPSVQLTAEDVSCTEVWLRLRLDDTTAHGTISISRDQQTFLTIENAPSDTIIVDDNLLPKHTYTYRVGSGAPVTITTKDTTSHEFTWEIDTLGDGDVYPSMLYDVAIVNDTLVYAVGEIYKKILWVNGIQNHMG